MAGDHDPKRALPFNTSTSSLPNNAPTPQYNEARLLDAYNGVSNNLGENFPHSPFNHWGTPSQPTSPVREEVEFAYFPEFFVSPQKPTPPTPAPAAERFAHSVQGPKQPTPNQEHIRQPQSPLLPSAPKISTSISHPISWDSEDCIDPALRSKPQMPACDGSPQPSRRSQENLLSPVPGTSGPSHLSCSMLRNSPEHDIDWVPSTPSPHIQQGLSCGDGAKGLGPPLLNYMGQGLGDNFGTNIPRTPCRGLEDTSRYGIHSDQYGKPAPGAGNSAMPRTPISGTRNNNKATKARRQTPAKNSYPPAFPITPQSQGREAKRLCANLSSSRNNPRMLASLTPDNNRDPQPYGLESLVERWISTNPREFPKDADIAVIANLAGGSINEGEVRDCFNDKFWPKPRQDSGYHSGEIPDLSFDPTRAPSGRMTDKMQLDKQQQSNISEATLEKTIPCGFEDCPAVFARSYERGRHQDSYHRGPKWECNICHKKYTRKDKLRDHMRLKHKDRTEEQIKEYLDRHDPDGDNDPGDTGSSGSRTAKQQPRGNQGGYGDGGTTGDSSQQSNSSSGSGYTQATTMSQCAQDLGYLQHPINDRYPVTASQLSSNRSHVAARTNKNVDSEPTHHLSSHILASGTSLPFRTVKNLGHGAHGSVDKVEHQMGGQVYARKTIKLNSSHAIRLVEQEVQLLKFMRHPHIVSLEGAFTDGSTACLLLPVADCDLKQLMHLSLRDERLVQSNISLWVWELTSALKYLHSADVSVIHGDLKPANILVFDSHVRITDFGSASFSNRLSQPPRPGPFTEVYAAPEAFIGSERGQKADIFSLGCVFVEMSTVLLRIPLDNFEDSRTTTAGNGKQNSSFHGHLPRVREWISNLRSQSSTHKFVSRVLDWCEQMLRDKPERRPKASTIARDMEHSTCSTCSRHGDAQEDVPNCCNKCTTANIPRRFSANSTSETGRPLYNLEKFRHHRDDTERLWAGNESVRYIHHQSLLSFLEEFDNQFCPSAYHTLQASNAFGR